MSHASQDQILVVHVPIRYTAVRVCDLDIVLTTTALAFTIALALKSPPLSLPLPLSLLSHHRSRFDITKLTSYERVALHRVAGGSNPGEYSS